MTHVGIKRANYRVGKGPCQWNCIKINKNKYIYTHKYRFLDDFETEGSDWIQSKPLSLPGTLSSFPISKGAFTLLRNEAVFIAIQVSIETPLRGRAGGVSFPFAGRKDCQPLWKCTVPASDGGGRLSPARFGKKARDLALWRELHSGGKTDTQGQRFS